MFCLRKPLLAKSSVNVKQEVRWSLLLPAKARKMKCIQCYVLFHCWVSQAWWKIWTTPTLCDWSGSSRLILSGLSWSSINTERCVVGYMSVSVVSCTCLYSCMLIGNEPNPSFKQSFVIKFSMLAAHIITFVFWTHLHLELANVCRHNFSF